MAAAAATAAAAAAAAAPARRFAVVGGGFAGVAAAWHLLAASRAAGAAAALDLYDAHGLGAGASGAAAGTLHPFTPRGRLLWRGAEAFEDALALVAAAERAAAPGAPPLAWRAGLLRPARTRAQAAALGAAAAAAAGAGAGAGAVAALGAAAMAARVPGLDAAALLSAEDLPPGGAAGLLAPRGLVLHPHRYLAAAWAAAAGLAAGGGARGGARLLLKKVESLDALRVPGDADVAGGGTYDAVVVAAGAAVGLIGGAAGALPLRLVQGCTLDLAAPPGGGADYPHSAPSLLGSTYLAARGGARATVGATRREGATPAEAAAALGGGGDPAPGSAEAAAAAAALLPAMAAAWPLLAGWRVERVRAGVRAAAAAPPALGVPAAAPFAGCLDAERGWWIIGGLGARGLVYHAWLGRLVAAAALGGGEAALPPELLRWRAGRP
jgi:glycine/D-amino acid oxidase-like deaminating enzyme